MKNKRKMLIRYLEKAESRLAVCILLFVLTVSSCEKRDPQVEYEILRETVYSNPYDGINAAQEYIDYFYKKSGARITEVTEIRRQYRKMCDFFDDTYDSYADFVSKGKEINQELSYSNYEGVRKTWSSLYESERNRLLGPLMDSITESDFNDFFSEQVRIICENEFNIWEVESVDQIFLNSPVLVNDDTAKKASGEYRIHLRGNILGVVTKVARISIEGTIGPDESGNINAVRTGYEILERPFLQ